MLARTTRSIAALAVAATLVTTVGAQSTTRISVDSAGTQGNAHSSGSSVSADGQFVAFSSDASNLVAGDTNGVADVFVRDMQTGVTTRVSVSVAGAQSNGYSASPSISADGRFVAFTSDGSNLVAGDINGHVDVFVRDRQAGTTEQVSVSTGGTQGGSISQYPAISTDGRFVSFQSYSNNLVLGDTNGTPDVFVRDRQLGTTERVSVTTGGAQGSNLSEFSGVSDDGRFVVFDSYASDLALPAPPNGGNQIYLRDRLISTTVLLSLNGSGAPADGASLYPSISSDGRFVAFASEASNLVTGDANFSRDVFVCDRQFGSMERVSVTTIGTESNADSDFPSISTNGHFVAYLSDANNLVLGDTNGYTDVFVHDLQIGLTSRVNVGVAETQANGDCYFNTPIGVSISGDGRFVAFSNNASNLVIGDTNAVFDVFVRDSQRRCYLDNDHDGFGVPPLAFYSLYVPCGNGYALNAGDCDDSNPLIHPGATEQCNGIDDNCNGSIDEGFVAAYCTSSTTVHGCVPWMAGEGTPSSTAANGFDVVAYSVEGNRMGLIYYGFYAASAPWAIGSTSYRCVGYPVQRTGASNSGGTLGQCNGEFRVDFNAWIQANPLALGYPFVAGQVFYAQGWFRDSGAPKGTNLSNGLRFTLCD